MKYWWIFGATFGAFVLFSGVVFGVLRWTDTQVAELGQFGDSFGVITSLFNSLVFASVVVTILIQKDDFKLQREDLKLQHEQLKLQHEELKLQRKELEQTRGVLSRQEEQLAAQVAAANQQLFETTFFNMLSSFRAVAGHVRYGGGMGMEAWTLAYSDLKGSNQAITRQTSAPPDAVASYRQWARSSFPGIDIGYMSTLIETMRFVDQRASDDEARARYGRIFRSQLSAAELGIIFHHGLDADESPRNLRYYIEKYNLLSTFRPEENDLPANRNGWYSVRTQLPGAHG